MSDELGLRLGGLDTDKIRCTHVAMFLARITVPVSHKDNLSYVSEILDCVFSHLETLYRENDLLALQVKFLAEQTEALHEQLGNYDRGVSLQINEEGSN